MSAPVWTKRRHKSAWRAKHVARPVVIELGDPDPLGPTFPELVLDYEAKMLDRTAKVFEGLFQ